MVRDYIGELLHGRTIGSGGGGPNSDAAKIRDLNGQLIDLQHSDDADDSYRAVETFNAVSDLLQHGVKGQKWGIRRTPAQLASASKSSGDTTKTSTSETSQDRYNRLKAQVKEKGAGTLSDDDLKFVTARAEAIARVSKMNQQDPGWLSEVSKRVLQKTAQESMQNIASAIATQYITRPVVKSLGAEPPKKKK